MTWDKRLYLDFPDRYWGEDYYGVICDGREWTLEDLYEEEERLAQEILELRRNEPAAKRKYEAEHRAWYCRSQGYIRDLQSLRDAICELKEEIRISGDKTKTYCNHRSWYM